MTKEEIKQFKDVISLKQFYWDEEKLFEKTGKRKCLLVQSFDIMTLSVSDDFSKYSDEYEFKIDYDKSYGRVNFHGRSITNAPIKLIYHKKVQQMTQEEKELLFKDLSARVKYGVVVHHIKLNEDYKVDGCLYNTIKGINLRKIEDDENMEPEPLIFVKTIDKGYQLVPTGPGDVLPYLRPMSSMTKEEKYTYRHMLGAQLNSEGESIMFVYIEDFPVVIDWLNAHHFDYRGLIEKGLALEAPEGMYNLIDK